MESTVKKFSQLLALVGLGMFALTGCDDAKPTNSMEGVDPAAVADYEQMIADETAAADTAAEDQEEGP